MIKEVVLEFEERVGSTYPRNREFQVGETAQAKIGEVTGLDIWGDETSAPPPSKDI